MGGETILHVGATGWWSYDNRGDLAMLEALRQGLTPHRVIPIDTGCAMNADVLHRFNRLDYLLLGGGTLIRAKPAEPFDTFDQWRHQLASPVGVIGLGVDSVLPQYRAAVDALLEQSQFFFVRDRESQCRLGDLKAQVFPDVTFAHPAVTRNDQFSISGRPICGVNLRHSENLDTTHWIDAISGLPVQIRGIPFSSFGLWHEHVLLHKLDSRTPDVFSPDLFQGLHLMIGVAFHSIVFAVQASVPVIAINYAPKVERFMRAAGLERYLLAMDEWDRLPVLVEEILANYASVKGHLLDVGKHMHEDALQMMQTARTLVERSGKRHEPSRAQVSIIVTSSGDRGSDEVSLRSCLEQTHRDVEVYYYTSDDPSSLAHTAVFGEIAAIRATPRADYTGFLQQALSSTRGEFLTWLRGGDRLAEDALDCMVTRMQNDPNLGLVYADYWATDDGNRLVGLRSVPGPHKLYRRDVVGPCFLARRRLVAETFTSQISPLLQNYHLWLRMQLRCRFYPFHAPLMFSFEKPYTPAIAQAERLVRLTWRKDKSWLARLFWGIIDSDFGEMVFVQPVAYLVRQMRRLYGRF